MKLQPLLIGALLLFAACSKESADEPEPKEKEGSLTGWWRNRRIVIQDYTLDNKLINEVEGFPATNQTQLLRFAANPDKVILSEVYPPYFSSDTTYVGPVDYIRSGEQLTIESNFLSGHILYQTQHYKIVKLTDKELVLQYRKNHGIPEYTIITKHFERLN